MNYCLLILAFFACASSPVHAQRRPVAKNKHAFRHPAEASRGRNSKARFRRESSVPVIDLNPRSLEKSKTTRAPKPYRYSKGI